jgi:hypothetical protein
MKVKPWRLIDVFWFCSVCKACGNVEDIRPVEFYLAGKRVVREHTRRSPECPQHAIRFRVFEASERKLKAKAAGAA